MNELDSSSKDNWISYLNGDAKTYYCDLSIFLNESYDSK